MIRKILLYCVSSYLKETIKVHLIKIEELKIYDMFDITVQVVCNFAYKETIKKGTATNFSNCRWICHYPCNGDLPDLCYTIYWYSFLEFSLNWIMRCKKTSICIPQITNQVEEKRLKFSFAIVILLMRQNISEGDKIRNKKTQTLCSVSRFILSQ